MKITFNHGCGNDKRFHEELGISDERLDEMQKFFEMTVEFGKSSDSCLFTQLKVLIEEAKSVEEVVFYTIMFERNAQLDKREDAVDAIDGTLDMLKDMLKMLKVLEGKDE